MGDAPINMRTLVHHIEHLVLYSLVLWQVVLGVWLILKWVNKNWKTKKTFSVVSDVGGYSNVQIITSDDRNIL